MLLFPRSKQERLKAMDIAWSSPNTVRVAWLVALLTVASGDSAWANFIHNSDFESGPILSPTIESTSKNKSEWSSLSDQLNSWYGYRNQYTIRTDGGNKYAHSEVPYVCGGCGKPGNNSYRKLMQVITAPGMGDYLFGVDYRMSPGHYYGQDQVGAIKVIGVRNVNKNGFRVDLKGNPQSNPISGAEAVDLLSLDLGAGGWPPGTWSSESARLSINNDFDYVVVVGWMSQPAGGWGGSYADLDNFNLSLIPEPASCLLLAVVIAGAAAGFIRRRFWASNRAQRQDLAVPTQKML